MGGCYENMPDRREITAQGLLLAIIHDHSCMRHLWAAPGFCTGEDRVYNTELS